MSGLPPSPSVPSRSGRTTRVAISPVWIGDRSPFSIGLTAEIPLLLLLHSVVRSLLLVEATLLFSCLATSKIGGLTLLLLLQLLL